MAEPTKKPTPLDQAMYHATTTGLGLQRALCMDGSVDSSFERDRAKFGSAAVPSTGEYCRELMKLSAYAERNPQRIKESPTLSLLDPYTYHLSSAELPTTDKNAADLVDTYFKIASIPSIAAKNFQPNIPANGSKKPDAAFMITPGTAYDTAFTKTVRDVYAGGTPPAPEGIPEAVLAQAADQCFMHAKRNTATIGQCTKMGKEDAVQYLRKTPISR